MDFYCLRQPRLSSLCLYKTTNTSLKNHGFLGTLKSLKKNKNGLNHIFTRIKEGIIHGLCWEFPSSYQNLRTLAVFLTTGYQQVAFWGAKWNYFHWGCPSGWCYSADMPTHLYFLLWHLCLHLNLFSKEYLWLHHTPISGALWPSHIFFLKKKSLIFPALEF